MGSGSKNCTDNMHNDVTRIRFFIFIKKEETLFRFKVHSSVSEASFRFVLQKKSADDMHLNLPGKLNQ